MKPWQIAVLMTIVGGQAILFIVQRGVTSVRGFDEAKGNDHAEVAALRTDLAALRKDVLAAKRLVVAPPKEPNCALMAPASGINTEPAPSEPKIDPSRGTQDMVGHNRDTINSLDLRLAQEDIDGEWSATTSRQIRDVIASEIPSSRLEEVQCASTLCKVVVRHTSTADAMSMARRIASTEPFSAGTFYSRDVEGDPLRMTLFVSRGGQTNASL